MITVGWAAPAPPDAKDLDGGEMVGCQWQFFLVRMYCGREIAEHGLCAEHLRKEQEMLRIGDKVFG